LSAYADVTESLYSEVIGSNIDADVDGLDLQTSFTLCSDANIAGCYDPNRFSPRQFGRFVNEVPWSFLYSEVPHVLSLTSDSNVSGGDEPREDSLRLDTGLNSPGVQSPFFPRRQRTRLT
jgi:hypothetical protein